MASKSGVLVDGEHPQLLSPAELADGIETVLLGVDGDGQHHQHGDDDQRRDCDATALTTGAVVGEAELKTTAAGLVFRQIEIVG